MSKNWNKIDDIFLALNEANIEYVILRNYEEIDDEEFCNSLHPDIDFLVNLKDVKRFCKVIHAITRFKNDDGIHYIINVNNKEIIIDIRTIGDGYYDKKWEKKIIISRIKLGEFYVPDFLNYYYSLVYHAVLHKKFLTDEYLNRLNSMAHEIQLNAQNEEDHLSELKKFMIRNNYFYTYPYDDCIPFQYKKIDKNLLNIQLNVKIRILKQKLIWICSIIKHKILKIK